MQADRAEALVAMRPRLLKRARRYTGDREAAEDLVQEALLRVWARLTRDDTVDDLEAYVTIALRHVAWGRPRPFEDEDAHFPPVVESDAEPRLAAADVMRALSHLPAHQKALLKGYAIEGASYAELAEQHRLPIGTVMSRVARARAQLRKEFDLPVTAPVTELLRKAH